MMNRRRLTLSAILIAMAAFNLSCDSSGNNSAAAGNGDAASPPPQLADFTYAVNWEGVVMQANYAKTKIDTAAHFTTDRNACGKDAYGSLDTTTWNTISKDINAIILTAPLDDKNLFCVPYPDHYKMDGNVSVELGGGKMRDLFSNVGGQICSTIRDPALSNDLLDALNTVVLRADKEDCNRGIGY